MFIYCINRQKINSLSHHIVVICKAGWIETFYYSLNRYYAIDWLKPRKKNYLHVKLC